MKILKRIAAGFVACAIACSAGVASAFAETTDEWNELNQAEFTSAMGLGWNLGNQFDAYSNGKGNETAWVSSAVTKDLIDMVKDAGFSSIRIPVTYMGQIGDGPDYTINEDWLNRIQEVVDWAVEDDLYVIINIHHDGNDDDDNGAWLKCSAEDQTEIKAKFKACWEQISTKFADYDEHLIFESMNEIGDGSWGNPTAEMYANLNDYNQIFIDTIRSTGGNNSKRWVLIPGWYTNISHTVSDEGFEIPDDSLCTADENRIAISVHYYDPYDFALNETTTKITQWGKDAESGKTNSWGQEDYLESQLASLNEKFVSQGYPVIIGEFGAIDKSDRDEKNNEYRAYFCETLVATAKANGIVPIYWDNGWNGTNGFGLFDRKNITVTQQGIIDSMVNAINADVTTSDDSSDSDVSSVTDVSSEVSSTTNEESSSESSAVTTSKATASTTTTSNPNTGAVAVAFSTIAIAGVAVVVSKKKNK